MGYLSVTPLFFCPSWFSRIQHLGAEIHLIRDMMEPIHTGGLHDFLLTALEVRDQAGSPRTCLPAPNTVVERAQSSTVCVSMGGVSGAVLRADGPHSPSGCSSEQRAEGKPLQNPVDSWASLEQCAHREVGAMALGA